MKKTLIIASLLVPSVATIVLAEAFGPVGKSMHKMFSAYGCLTGRIPIACSSDPKEVSAFKEAALAAETALTESDDENPSAEDLARQKDIHSRFQAIQGALDLIDKALTDSDPAAQSKGKQSGLAIIKSVMDEAHKIYAPPRRPRAAMNASVVPASSTLEFPKPSTDSEIYNQLFPRHLEICAETQMQNRGGGGGGKYGHATAFIKGVCLDNTFYAPATRAKKCEVKSDLELANSEMGIGISTAAEYMNVRWLGSQGRRMYFHGKTLQSGEPYNVETSMRDKAAANKVFATWGVLLHENALPKDGSRAAVEKSRNIYKDLVLAHKSPAELSDSEKADIAPYQETVTNNSMSTDFALDTARNSYCVRVPISEGQTEQIISYLNSENDKYRDLKKVFHWEPVKDNCAHMVHDLAWIAGLTDKLIRNLPKGINLTQVAVPAKEIANLGSKLSTFDYSNPYAVFTGFPERGWKKFGWFASPLGVVSEFVPARGRKSNGDDGAFPQDPSGNQFFITNAFVDIGDVAVLPHKRPALERFMLSPETTDLRANLEASAATIEGVLQKLQIKSSKDFLPASLAQNATYAAYFQKFYDDYKAELQTSLEKAHQKLSQLETLETLK